MSMNMPPPTGTAGKVVTAFFAGAVIGAVSMAQIVPSNLAGAPQAFAGDVGSEGFGGDELVDDQFVDDSSLGTTGGAFGAGQGSTTTTGGLAGGNGTTGSGTAGGATSGSTTGTATSGSGTGVASTAGTGGDDGSSGSTDGGSATSGGGGGVNVGGSGSGSTSGSSSTSGTSSGGPAGCTANSNGGATDTGVSATEIHVAATTVEDGAGESLLKPAIVGMTAIINKVNAGGGICGRRIVLETRNDNWDAARGRDFIRRFIEEGKFALLVVPSSEGLAEAIKAGMISQAQIPVVGTTGLRVDEYKDPWVWPVATATLSYMRAMAKHAYDQGDRAFGIIWDNKFRFGVEGATAFKDYVKTLPGTSMKADIPLDPEKGQYQSEAQKFNGDCGISSGTNKCDMVALLLVPDTANDWRQFNQGPGQGRGKRTYGAQTLFTDDFATRCGGWCNGVVVWTGYNPPIPPADNAGVKQYVRDVQAVLPSVDARNQFVEGAYLGTQLFVHAVERCSPNLTRVCIKQTLDSIDFATQLANKLSWRPNARHANKFAQAFRLEASGGGFNGWQYQQTGWIADPGL